tara:strand:- start:81 stop:275 length:195 start_codon:yes stop_codon:yes gene_type:complete
MKERIQAEITETKQQIFKIAIEINKETRKIKGRQRDRIHIDRITRLTIELSNLHSVLIALKFVQ